MLILAGFGNPEAKYLGNRHNIGFMVMDRLAEAHRAGPWRQRFHALAADAEIETGGGTRTKALLLKPQKYYNNVGLSIAEAMRFFKLTPEQVVVFYDEIDLAPGRVRTKLGGGAAGNNGIRSTIAALGEDGFRRVRIGVGHPGHKDLVMRHVLSDFAKAEEPWVRAVLDAIAQALPFLAAGEDERFQTEVMRLAPAPKHDPRKGPQPPEA